MKKIFFQNNNSGQSLIEFLMTSMMCFGIIFLFFKLAFNATSGYMVHYATYMAARRYYVFDNNSGPGSHLGAEREARSRFNGFAIRRFMITNPVFKIYPRRPNNRTSTVYNGAVTTFTQKQSLFPVIGGTQKMEMVSEAFLGKETTRRECLASICEVMKAQLGKVNSDDAEGQNGCPDKFATTLYDNGC